MDAGTIFLVLMLFYYISIMQNIFKALTFIFWATIMVGCSKSSNKSTDILPVSPISGKWNYSNDTTHYYTNGFNYLTATYPAPPPECYFQFNNDGTGKQVVSTYVSPLGGERIGDTATFKYSVLNDKIELISTGNRSIGLDVNGLSLSATIKTLNSSELFLLLDTTTILSSGVKYEVKEDAHFTK